jgi:hypothetical protein
VEDNCISYLSFFVNEKTIDCEMDNKTLKIIADKKPLTTKPSTNLSQSITIIALMMSRKSPKVRIVTGNVKNTIIGFTKMLSNPKTMATMIEVVNDCTVMSSIK